VTSTPSFLYEPIDVLKQVGDDLWIVDGPEVVMFLYGLKVPFPTRMTIARLSNGDLWCHSPTVLTADLKAQIDGLGPVRHLVSPNKIHYVNIGAWASAYPEATTWASPGVRTMAQKKKAKIRFDADLQDQAPLDWRGDLEQMIFHGNAYLDEVVFYHPKSRTLILTDLIENFEPARLNQVSRSTRWLLQIGGCIGPDGQAPLDLRLAFCPKKREARRSFQRLLAWQPERLLFAHGRWCERDGTQQLLRSFRWLTRH